jgi:S-disulfanyl-L-cysteine oxidoreductase SoxD
MRTTERRGRRAGWAAAVVAAGLAGVISPAATAQTRYGFGHPATAAEISSWDIEVAPDGRNLPRGEGTFARGRELYAARCAACHGAKGEGGLGDKLVGGAGSLATATPVKTIGSYWPYATTLFDYIRRAMPLDSPQSLSNDDVYAVSGYLLYLNGLVPEGTTVDARTLMSVKMPNRDGFVDDPRPDVK